MNEKIKTLILVVVFLIVIVSISVYMNNREGENIAEQNIKVSMENVNSVENSNRNSSIIEVNEENFETEVLDCDKKVLIDFYATWCGPCKMLHPILEDIAEENLDLKIVQIDVDKCEKLVDQYSIRAMPTIVVLENGREFNRLVGLTEKEEILKICVK